DPKSRGRSGRAGSSPSPRFLSLIGGHGRGSHMPDWAPREVRVLPVDAFGLGYRRYRLPDAEAEAAMARSLERYGQIAPVVVCLREETPEVLDGFKRVAAARALPGLPTLSARLLAVDDRSAKAAIYGLNR